MSDTQQEPTRRNVERSSTAKEHAKSALEYRSKKSSNTYYYGMVIIFFVAVLVLGAIYLVYEWKGSPNLVKAVSEENIAKHNEKKRLFKRGPNTLFAVLFYFIIEHLIR
jgi:Na+/H+ antiporter NhaD/arsenite permease-like protein